MQPGTLDADGWLVPKKPRAFMVYTLTKAGLKPREIAILTNLTPASIRVMRWCIKHPYATPYGPSLSPRLPKTRQKRYDFTGKHVERNRRHRRELVPVTNRERLAYAGTRYDQRQP